ncbi:MAG: hypothetical protein VB934_19345 [Polyangiaceae bacterium]
MNWPKRRACALALTLLGAVGCSESDAASGASDSSASSSATGGGSGAVNGAGGAIAGGGMGGMGGMGDSCDPSTPYPEGPYGNGVGDVVADLQLFGYRNDAAAGLSKDQPLVPYRFNDMRCKGYALVHLSDYT